MPSIKRLCLFLLFWLLIGLASFTTVLWANSYLDFAGYTNCLLLHNKETKVVLGPHCGGRILSYSWQGREAIPLNPAQNGYIWRPGVQIVDPYGGRFDIGPEMTIGRHLDLWLGPWRAQFTGPREAVMISRPDRQLGVQLIRFFRLDPAGSHLRCTQKIINRSAHTLRICHWSRTFAQGQGICLVPLNPYSRFPKGYLTYGPGAVMDFRPVPNENVRIREGFLEIRGDPPFSKFMMDTEPGELAYLMRHNVIFIKKWPVYPSRAYGEMCAATLSIYYYPSIEERRKPPEQRALPLDFCELEPIGPLEILKPSESALFSEDWWLLPYRFPSPGEDVNLSEIKQLLASCLYPRN